MLNLINAKNESFPEFTVAALRAYLSGTDSTYSGNETLKSILDSAASVSASDRNLQGIASSISNTSVSDGDVYLSFTMNPANNPTYTVSGLSIDASTAGSENYTDGYYNYYADSTINASVSVGLDGTNLDTSTVSIYYTKDGDDSKKLFWTWNYDVALKYAVAGGLDEATAAANIQASPKNYRYTVTSKDENSDAMSVTSSLGTNEIVSGFKYSFSIEGKDIDGQPIVQSASGGFGFMAKSNTSAPRISFGASSEYLNLATQSVFTENIFNGRNLKFSGTVSSPEPIVSEYYEVTVSDSADSSKSFSSTVAFDNASDSFEQEDDNLYSYNWSFALAPTDEMKALVSGGSGLYIVDVVVSAANGGGDARASRTYYLDTAAPSVSNVSISGGYTDSAGTIYINNTRTFALSGTSTDNYLIGGTSYSFEGIGTNGKSLKVLAESANTNISWNFENIDLSAFVSQKDKADIVLKVTATDKASSQAESTYNIEIDTTAPAGKHVYDKAGKDLIFRIGESGNALEELKAYDSTISDIDESLDEDVGGKYKYDSWGNSQTITIRGDWTEEGSGVAMVYYKIYTDKPADEELTSFLDSYETLKDGYFAPAIEDDDKIKRVSCTDEDGNIVFKNIASSFKTTISGLSAGNNYLVLVAVDNVGNAGIDTLEASCVYDNSSEKIDETELEWNGKIPAILLNVDIESPSFSSTSSGTVYTNKIYPITVSGAAADSASGIASVALTLNGNSVAAETGTEPDDTSTSTHWNVQISSDILSALDGTSYNVALAVTDNAGNQTSSTVFTLQIDTSAPVAEISSPVTGGTALNGKIAVSGTVEYESALPERLELYYILTEPDSSTSIESLTQIGNAITDVAKIYSWSFSGVDVTELSKADASNPVRKIYLVPVVYDTAGNCNIYTELSSAGSATDRTYSYIKDRNYFEYTVDQNTDRPIVKISNLTAENGAFILKYGTNAQITGTITDDDATSSAAIDSLVISESPYTGSETITGTTAFSKSSGDFTFTPSDTSDGEKSFYIYIKDNAGGVFYTTATTGTAAATNETTYLNNPVLYLKTEMLDDSVAASQFTYKSDSSSPAVENAQSYTYSSESQINTAIDSSGNEVAYLETLGSSFIAGGLSKPKIQLVISASDANGIAGMTAELLRGAASIGKYATSSAYTGFTQSVAADGFTATANGATAVWTTGLIDLSDTDIYASGTYTLSVTAYDTSGLHGNGTYSFLVDQTAPEIKITSPSSSDEVTGDTKVSGTALDQGGSSTASVYWFVPTKEQIDSVTTGSAASYWRSEILSAISSSSSRAGSVLDSGSNVNVWTFIFGSTGSSPALTAFDDDDFVDSSNTSIYNIPLYIMAEDELGNYAVESEYTVRHNPDGDKPVTAITYPDMAETTLGGTIRLSGTVTIPSNTTTASASFIQIDKSAALESGYVEGLTDSGGSKIYTVYSAADAIKEIIGTDVSSSSYSAYGFASEDAFNSWWGIKASKSSSSSIWTRNINSNGEFDPEEKGTTSTIYLRACGINANGKVGAWTSTYTVNVDNSAPTIAASLNQFSAISQISTGISSAAVSASTSASKSYSANMYLKDQWYISAQILDETGVSSVTVTENGRTKNSYNIVSASSSALSIPSGYYIEAVEAAENGIAKKGFKVYIPVSQTNTNDGLVSYTLAVVDSDLTNHTASMEFVLNIDNTAPSIDFVSGNGDSLAADGKTTYTASSRYSIQEKNYIFTPGGKVSDSGSGYERVLFQFVRGANDTLAGGTKAVLDPMVVASGNDYSSAKAEIDGTVVLAQKVWQDSSTAYSLYGKSVAGTLSSASTFTAKASGDISSDKHIREHGVVYIEGVYRVIESISGEVVTFDPALPSEPSSAAEAAAFFPYAQAVDNTSTEKLSSSSYSDNPLKLSTDDGDGMMETITKLGTTWTWDAAVHSTNLPDGPASMIVLAFDKAGNVSGVEIPVMIANNAPRLAKVWLGTDLNGDGKYTLSSRLKEIVEYNILGAEGREQEKYELDFTATGSDGKAKYADGTFTIKNGLAVIPEFTGGNGAVGMVFSSEAQGADAVAGAVQEADSSAVGTETLSASDKSNSVYAFVIGKDRLGTDSSSETDTKGMSFTFWDKTEETVQGESSQNAVLYVKNFIVAQNDAVPPVVRINPFYWESGTSNSLYQNSKDNGHIELEEDLPDELFTENGNVEYDRDPKVSGKIVFTGTAYDEHALSKVTATYGTITAEASYDASSQEWTGSGTLGEEDDESGYKLTVYDAPPSSACYSTDTAYFDQQGHKVYWTLAVDTEKAVETAAASDTALQVLASDASASGGTDGKSANTTSTEPATDDSGDAKYNKPSYQTDVVPYITRLSTSLDGAYSSNTSVFNRSAQGKYPVRKGETISLYGFNLGEEPSVTAGSATPDVSAGDGCITFAAPDASGKLSVKVNEVESLNNVNSTPSFENYEAKTCTYNAEGNGINNKLLDDDRELYVWSFETVVSDSAVRYPSMRVGKDSNQSVGFVYDSGAKNVNYYLKGSGSATNSSIDVSYSQWYSTSVAVDANGNIYGSAQNGDSGGSSTMDTNGNLYANYKYYAFPNKVSWNFSPSNGRAYNQGGYCAALEWDYVNSTFYPERILNPKVAIDADAYVSGTGFISRMYTVYYDKAYNRIVFRYGVATQNSSTVTFDSSYGISGRTKNTSSSSNYQVIAGQDSSGASSAFSDGNTDHAGEYSAVGVVPSTVKTENGTAGTAVVAWYDDSTQSLLFSYNENPSSTDNAANWGSNTRVIDSNFAGWYVDMAVDPDGGIHIAYYGAANGDLKYAYLPSYKSEAQVCVVDSYLSVGTNISVDYKQGTVTKSDGTEETRYVPYISYYMSAFTKTKNSARVAWLSRLGEGDVVADGAASDVYTGSWEVMTLPEEQIPLDYTIGVGIKKNSSSVDSPILGYGTAKGLRTAILE